MMAEGIARLCRGILLVAAVAGMVVVAPQDWAQVGDAPAPASAMPAFDVVTIKPGDPDHLGSGIGFDADTFTARGQTVKVMMEFAYNLNTGTEDQIVGGPSWVGTKKFDVVAKMDADTIAALSKLPNDQRNARVRWMMKELLEERFKLKVHHETKELPVYALTVGKGGPKLTPSVYAPHGPDGKLAAQPSNWHGVQRQGLGKMEFRDATPQLLTYVLGLQPEINGRMVIDRTGLKGTYDFALTWTPDTSLGKGSSPSGDAGAPVNTAGPSLFTALQEQVGLKVESAKAPVDTIVIDSIEIPSEN
jgi:uncharacterized protein (TIGR03435 family)